MIRGRGAGSTGSGEAAVRLTTSYHRSAWWWMSVVCGGFAVVMALAILKVGAAAPASVQLTGSAQGAGTARSYDIVVSPPNSGLPGESGGWTANPAEMDTLSGGITVAQYNAIRKLAGVEVAAPLTMVGYIPFTVSTPIIIPASMRSTTPQRVTLTVRLRSDNGLSTVTWDDVTLANPDVRTSALSIQLSWTFELPLVAVDPVAEARLLHLNNAVASGSYLPAAAASPSQPVPMLMAGSIASDEAAQVTVDPQGAGMAAGTATLTMASAYQQLVADAGKMAGTIPAYWTAGPVSYQPAAGGQLMPQPVATELADVWNGAYMWAGAPADAGALDVPFRSLTEHAALAGGAAVRAVGVFDPAKIAGAPDTPSPYQPELLAGADPRSRQLLGGRPLAADGDPGAYPGSAASLVMPLADIGAFTRGYAGVKSAAPIGVIRVRVAGAAGDAAASQDRIRAVAQEIVRATGLHVQAVLGSTATTRVVDLPAGLHGRPPLRVDEVWYRSDIETTVWSGLGPDSIVLAELELLAGEMVIAWGTWRLMRARRGELATLRALGWRRGQLGRQLLAEFALTAVVAVAAAVLAGYAIGAALAGRPDRAWLLLSIPAVIAVVVVETRWPLLRTMARVLAEPLPRGRPRWAPARQRRRAQPARSVRRLLRTPSRMLLSTFVIAVGCVALSLEVAARWAFAGAATPWTERPVSWQGTVVDDAAVLLVVLMATFTVADLALLTLRERAVEVRTLRAIGWSASDLARLTLQNALWPGLAGGLIAAGFVLLGGLAVAGSAPPRLVALSALAAAAGLAMSLLAASLPTIFGGSGVSTNK
jgi:putative ABC transport system permease protein